MRTPLVRRLVALVVGLLTLGVTMTPASAADSGLGPPQTERDRVRWIPNVREVFRTAFDRAACRLPVDQPVPELVAGIFACRLAGRMPDEEVVRVVAEAAVVAHCESLFDPHAVVFDGRYIDRPHPRTGMRYTATGVFQFIRKTGDLYIEGGHAAATDPARNIDAAARLYLDNRARGARGWEDWECSAVNGDFKANSVLPGWPGGPERLPFWARELAERIAPVQLEARRPFTRAR